MLQETIYDITTILLHDSNRDVDTTALEFHIGDFNAVDAIIHGIRHAIKQFEASIEMRLGDYEG